MQRNRLVAIVLAVGAQFLFVILLIDSLPRFTRHNVADHEITMVLPHLLRATPKSSPTPKSGHHPVPVTPRSVTAPVATASVSPETLHSLRVALFDCAPEYWSRLSAQDRTLCPPPNNGAPIHGAPSLMGTPSHVRDNAHWIAEWKWEKAPLLLPGASPDSFGISVSSNGGLTQQHYTVKRNASEDFYKIDQAYDAWHKAHPVPGQ